VGVRKLDNWMGDRWTLRRVDIGKPEMDRVWGKCDFGRKEIVYQAQSDHDELSTIMHEVIERWLRAEIPGKFSALPTKAHAMYAPELKANSDEIKIRIED